jgi:hypothetical protein
MLLVTLDESASIFGMAFSVDRKGKSLLFAAGSQDRLIRVWRITSCAVSMIFRLYVAIASSLLDLGGYRAALESNRPFQLGDFD